MSSVSAVYNIRMLPNKFGRIVLGLYSSRSSSVCGVVQTTVSRNGFSWTAVCKKRTLWLQRCAGEQTQQHNQQCQSSTRSVHQTTVDPEELKRFQTLASKWWDENGEFKALHAMNDLRVPFIRDNLLNVHKAHHPGKPLAGRRILDVGCGGGLLTEPLGRLGASVLGIDPVEDSISMAQLHSSYDPDLGERVRYRACTLEELSADVAGDEVGLQAGLFDAIVASEVVEHLADLETFALCCGRVLKPGGSLFITTINKTNLSYALAIVVAEQLLCIVPSGTHDWEKFISPVELERHLESNGFSVQSVQGMFYNPASGAWSWANSTAINYALHAVKVAEDPKSEPQSDNQDSSEATH
ncbi:ubiquinone biosynthesis O-methyltransferase, mitochondrial [Dunckerocampus dactyliophorus]|uniref:ubiquinone biosynthesis O-methyltransferase, mitochondrial n=1 Tax=Dunckerocampus dactyliophorus TaxID=161453 RepID=UPI0024054BD3|nr:ubiquinone biosynthesis O-methyltransferase, mitochondrial [Dunckerocampus dactyliophorus]